MVLVFVAGGVLMGLEIVGSRVLAPHFGNSVFVWGSLISIFLSALSIGYYVGGWVADRHPSQRLLNAICVAVSILIFSVAVLAQPVCNGLIAIGAGEQTGPLLASVVLFLPASVGMGMVSPFAVRLATRSVESVGTAAGTLYALSTIGSIAGTLLTTFILIPWIGMGSIIQGLAGTMLLVALLTAPRTRGSSTAARLLVFALLAILSLLWEPPLNTTLASGDRVVLAEETPYHHITVIDNRLTGTRQLRFDRYVESAIRHAPPYPSQCVYTDYFHLAFLIQPRPERALFIGAGGGVGPRAFLSHRPELVIDVVDIDTRVLDIARDLFYVEPGDRLRLRAADGRIFLRTTQEQYDCILLDAFSIGGRIPFHLVTQEAFQLCRDRLRPGGVLVMNLISALDGPRAEIYHSIHRTVASVFPRVHTFAVNRRLVEPTESTNIILVATVDDLPLSLREWQARGLAYDSPSTVPAERMRRIVGDLVETPPDMSRAPLLTDDYAPLETMSF
jgi:spermidine synthase